MSDRYVSGDMFLSGNLAGTARTEYPSISLSALQTSAAGTMSGPDSGPLNTLLTRLRITDAANPYFGRGFVSFSYQSAFGEGQGWAYAGRFGELHGLMIQPLYGLFEGLLDESTNPRTLLISRERLDIGLPFGVELSLKTGGPEKVSPGQVASYLIELRNDGFKAAENITLVAFLPQRTDFVSASGDYSYLNLGNWINEDYQPVPLVRWDFSQIAPRTALSLNIQAKIRIGAGPMRFWKECVHHPQGQCRRDLPCL